MNSKAPHSGWSKANQRIKPCPVMCYDFEGDLQLLECLMGEALPKNWEIENVYSQLDTDRLVAYFAELGREHHALYDAPANAYAFVRGLP